jgi:hypothetical protein
VKIICKKGKRGHSNLHSWSLLVVIMEEEVLVVVSWGCFCGLRQKLALGWCIAI